MVIRTALLTQQRLDGKSVIVDKRAFMEIELSKDN